jgi:hypothetical protein
VLNFVDALSAWLNHPWTMKPNNPWNPLKTQLIWPRGWMSALKFSCRRGRRGSCKLAARSLCKVSDPPASSARQAGHFIVITSSDLDCPWLFATHGEHERSCCNCNATR